MNIKCPRAALGRLDGGRDVFGSLDFRSPDLKTERSGSCLNLAHLQYKVGIADIGQDRQPAQTRDNLPQEVEPLASKVSRLVRQASDVAARSCKTRDEVIANRVRRRREYDRDDLRRLL